MDQITVAHLTTITQHDINITTDELGMADKDVVVTYLPAVWQGRRSQSTSRDSKPRYPAYQAVVLTTRPICPICLIFSKSLFVWPWLIFMCLQCCFKCSVLNKTGRQLRIESVKDSGGDVWQLLLRMWMAYCSDLGPDIDTPDTIRIFSVSPSKCYNSL